jgi:hypothetical protein
MATVDTRDTRDTRETQDTRDPRRVFRNRRLALGGLAAGVAGLALCALGAWRDPARAMSSYLAAYAYAASLAVGVLAFSMIGRAMGATWVLAVRRLEEAVLAALPALAVLFAPVIVGAGHLYLWAHPEAANGAAHGAAHGAGNGDHLAHLLHHKAPYLELGFFTGRAVFYLVVWVLLGELFRRWSLATERAYGRAVAQGSPEPALDALDALDRRSRRVSAAMLPLFGLTVTFAAFDWLMSLEPEWFSSAYGVYYAAGSLVGGMALLTLLAHRARARGPLAEELSRFHFHALGRVLLAFVVFWAYIAFFQSMLIQIANRPEETTFYVRRLTGSWEAFSYALAAGHFALPFFLLLPRPIKYRSRALAGVSVWLLVMHYLDVYWLVMPAHHPGGLSPHWLDLAALAGVGGMATTMAAWRQYGRSLLVEGHPRMDRALRYRSVSA